MTHTARGLLTVVFLGGTLAMPAARAQAPALPPASAVPAPAPAAATRPDFSQLVGDLPAPLPASEAPAPEAGWEPQFLRSLPRPPDQPRSLSLPAPPLGPPPPDLERPYFQLNPLLDPPQWPRPGWFTAFQIDIIHPHFFANQLKGTVVTPSKNVNVALGSARLNWTVAPRLEVGYRLASGFGSFSVSDRGFWTDGTGPFSGPAGSFTRTSHLGVNYTDMDYASREYTPWANWSMNWRVGVRVAYTWFDTRVDQPFDAAATGNGVFAARTVNYTTGAGPHFGLELDHGFSQPGLFFVSKLDIADTFSRVRQRFSEASTTLTPAGKPSRGEFLDRFWQEIPILNFQVGLGWHPPAYPNVHLFMGYVYEFWWQVGTNSNTQTTHGFFDNQGVVLQAGVNF
jgi:hypothetical protein